MTDRERFDLGDLIGELIFCLAVIIAFGMLLGQ